MLVICVSVPGVGMKSLDAKSHSVSTLSEEHCAVGSNVDTQSDDMSEASTSQVATVHHVASHPPQPLLVNSDIACHSDDVVGDIRVDSRHVQEDDLDVPSIEAVLDDTVYHDCISASFTGKLLLFSSVLMVFFYFKRCHCCCSSLFKNGLDMLVCYFVIEVLHLQCVQQNLMISV